MCVACFELASKVRHRQALMLSQYMISSDDDDAESLDSRIEEAAGEKFDKMVDELACEETDTCPMGLSSRSTDPVEQAGALLGCPPEAMPATLSRRKFFTYKVNSFR